MLRRTDPIPPTAGLGMQPGMFQPVMPQLAGRRAERTRWLWLVPLLAGFLVVAGWVLVHDPGKGLALSSRGRLAIAAAAVLMGLLAVHRHDGLRHLARTVAEYTVVAVLAALLATTAAGGDASQQAPHPNAPAQARAAATGDACPSVLQVRAWLTCLWHQASKPAKTDQKPATTTTRR
jgi:hypothetical protein